MDRQQRNGYKERIPIRDDISLVFLKQPPVQSMYPNVERIMLNRASKVEYLKRKQKAVERSKNQEFVIPLDVSKIYKRRSLDQPQNDTSKMKWARYTERKYIRWLESNPQHNPDTGDNEDNDGNNESEETAKNKVRPNTKSPKFEKISEPDFQRKVENDVVTIQKYARRFLARKKFHKMKHRKFQRMKTIEEFYQTERSYLRDMKVFDSVYYQKFIALEKKNQSPISLTIINHLFSGLPTIIRLSEQLIQNLEKTIFIEAEDGKTSYNHYNRFGKELVEISPFLKMYMNYCGKHSKNLTIINELNKKNKKFAKILLNMDTDQRTDNLGISSYLHKPISRVLKYKLFLRGLLKNTDSMHPDYNDLVKASDSISDISNYLNESIRELEKSEKVMKIQRLFVKKNANMIYSQSRKFIARGIFQWSSGASSTRSKKERKRRTCYVHLFNDVVTFSTKERQKFKLDKMLQLKHVSLFSSNGLQYKRMLRINHIILTAGSSKDKDMWLYLIFKEMQKVQQRQSDDYSGVKDGGYDHEIDELLEDEPKIELNDEECVLLVKDIDKPTKMWKYVNRFDNVAKKIFNKFLKPHERLFVITPGENKIQWGSKKKTLSESSLEFENIRELVVGQTTPSFKRFPKPELENQSFSLLYGAGEYLEDGWSGDSLDLICESKTMFEVWVRAIRFIMHDKRVTLWRRVVDTREISKIDLTINKKLEKKRLHEAFRATGDGYSWGRGTNFALGHGENEDDVRHPKIIFSLLLVDVIEMSCGENGGCCLTKNGKVLTWGDAGVVGHGDRGVVINPKPLQFNKKIVQVAMGSSHVLFLDSSGNVHGCGENDYGQLGNISENCVGKPTMTISTEKYPMMKSIYCGHNHSGSVTKNGETYLWGMGKDGQLSTNLANSNNPRLLDSLEEATKSLALGCWHTLILSQNGFVFSLGSNQFGCLGVREELKTSLNPVKIPGLRNIVQIASGSAFCGAVNHLGELFTWGSGNFGQLGNGKLTKISYVPTRVETIVSATDSPLLGKLRFEQICFGANHSAALIKQSTKKGDVRKIVTWGAGTFGRCGHSNIEHDVKTPKVLDFFVNKTVRRVSAGCSSYVTNVISGHRWVNDDETMSCMNSICKRKFTTLNRRHHCRNCGGIFCDRCSQQRIPILAFGFDDDVRVCDKCFSRSSRLQNKKLL